MLSTEKKISLIEKVTIAALVFCVLLPLSPRYVSVPSRDSGVFMYAGWRILYGEIPYRDFWDHKPPLIFYTNALGLGIAGGSRWGVWALEAVSLFAAALIAFKLMKKAFGLAPSIVASLIWLKILQMLINGGNFTTEYTIPFQLALLLLFWNAEREPGGKSWDMRWFYIGVISAAIFLFKQNVIAISCAIALYLCIQRIWSRQFKKLSREYLLIFFGGIVPIALVVAYFYFNNALADFWSAAFQFNFAYCAPGEKKTIFSHLSSLMKPYWIAGGPKLFVAGAIAVLLTVFALKKKKEELHHTFPLIYLAIIALPIELAFVSASGRSYNHYYMALVPVVAVLAGLVMWSGFTILSAFTTRKLALVLATILLAAAVFPYPDLTMQPEQTDLNTAINYVKNNSSPDDYVLVWGTETTVNFMSRRACPTRYVYQYPLYEKRYATVGMAEDLVQSVMKHPPKFIIDTSNPVTPYEKFLNDFYLKSPEIERGVSFIKQNYREVHRFGKHINTEPWIIYEYSPQPN